MNNKAWLFIPHNSGDLDEYFNSNHEKAVADTAKEIVSRLCEEHIGKSDEIVYSFEHDDNADKIKNTMLRYADMILRADITIKLINSKYMKSEMENVKLKKRIAELEGRKQ